MEFFGERSLIFTNNNQNNGLTTYRQSFLDGQFFVAGSEIAAQYPDYMDGTVRSVYFIYEALKSK